MPGDWGSSINFPTYLYHLYDYNYWANDGYLDAAEALTEDQLYHQQSHSWGSIHGVLLHMMNAEWIWLRRWQGQSPGTFHEAAEFPTLMALRQYWARLEVEMRAFVAAQTEQSLGSEIAYTTTLGQKYHLPLWQMMVHVANHNTHHRGELAAMFASINAPHPEDEWNHYFLAKSGQR